MRRLTNSRLVLPVAAPLLLTIAFVLGFVAGGAQPANSTEEPGEITARLLRLVNEQNEVIGTFGDAGDGRCMLTMLKDGKPYIRFGMFGDSKVRLFMTSDGNSGIELLSSAERDLIAVRYTPDKSAVELVRDKPDGGSQITIDGSIHQGASITLDSNPPKGDAYFSIVKSMPIWGYRNTFEPNTKFSMFQLGDFERRDEFDHKDRRFIVFNGPTRGADSQPNRIPEAMRDRLKFLLEKKGQGS